MHNPLFFLSISFHLSVQTHTHILPNHVTSIYFLHIMCIKNRSFTHSTWFGSSNLIFRKFSISSFTFYAIFHHTHRYTHLYIILFNDYVYKQTIKSDDIKFQPKIYIILLIIQIGISYHPLVVLYTLC